VAQADPGTVEYTLQVVPSAPSGTTVDAPTSTPVNLPAFSWLWRVEVRIPAGHQGVTGLALVDGTQFIVPFANPGPAWLIGDDDLLEYPYDKEVGSSVVMLAYNNGSFDHAWQVRLIYTPIAVKDEGGAVIVTPGGAAGAEEASVGE
jgi:hypothetical protein